ncbi:MAG: thiamine phosphate synthase [Campylobacterales bacterium]|nr:thiamine phosphate synthase [Campylobacterales bacterium]
MRVKVKHLQRLCAKHDAQFVLNDKIDLAIELGCDGLHIGKSDHHRFEEIRANFNGFIGVSCSGDVEHAKEFEQKGADCVTFGSFFSSPTKPDSNIVPLEVIKEAKQKLQIPVCVIGGITIKNLDDILEYKPDMVSVISDI